MWLLILEDYFVQTKSTGAAEEKYQAKYYEEKRVLILHPKFSVAHTKTYNGHGGYDWDDGESRQKTQSEHKSTRKFRSFSQIG